MMQAESSFLPERMSRFVAGWLLASIVPALPLIVIWTQTVLLLGSSANERRAGLLAFSGIVLFLLLFAVGNWLFMRHRGTQPIAWGAMTIIGAAFGLVVAGVVVVLGPPLMSNWYFVTADDLIDSPLPPAQMTELLVAVGAGIVFGFGLSLFQAIALPFSMLARLSWLVVSISAVTFAFVAAFLLDLGYDDFLDLIAVRVPSAGLWFWSPRIAVEVVIAILIYALPTGVVLRWLLRCGRRRGQDALADRFD